MDLESRGTVDNRSENKGADQLWSYCTADLRLCFRIGKKPGFLVMMLNNISVFKHFMICNKSKKFSKD